MAAFDHVPVPRHLRVETAFRHVEPYLHRIDPDLRLRKSAEQGVPQQRGCEYVLERRVRRRPISNAGLHDDSDWLIQARDGYVHVSLLHRNWLYRPWNIIRALKTEGADLFAEGAQRFADELEYEEAWAKETKRRRRFGLLRDIAVDAFDPLSRMGNRDGTERTRISNPGLPAATPAGEGRA